MNAREAREQRPEHQYMHPNIQYYVSRGFLEAIDHAKPVVEQYKKMIEALMDIHDIAFDGDGDPACVELGKELADMAKVALSSSAQVLETYRRNALGEKE